MVHCVHTCMLTDFYKMRDRVAYADASQKLLLFPPHLHNAAALSWKKYDMSSIGTVKRTFENVV